MSLKQRLDQDLKSSLKAGDSLRTSVLRSLKSAITYAEVAKGANKDGVDDTTILELFKKEAKKRQDSVDMYNKGGRPDRAEQELQEKNIIEGYLPAQLTDDELTKLVNKAVSEIGLTQQTMGRVIAEVKSLSQGRADGAAIAKLVKERL